MECLLPENTIKIVHFNLSRGGPRAAGIPPPPLTLFLTKVNQGHSAKSHPCVPGESCWPRTPWLPEGCLPVPFQPSPCVTPRVSLGWSVSRLVLTFHIILPLSLNPKEHRPESQTWV